MEMQCFEHASGKIWCLASRLWNSNKIEEFEHKPTMTCRIDRLLVGEEGVLLSISGRITGQYVDVLRGLLEQERSAVAIDLKGVLLVDREAVQLLALSEAKGIELRNCPGYIREWIARERAKMRDSPE